MWGICSDVLVVLDGLWSNGPVEAPQFAGGRQFDLGRFLLDRDILPVGPVDEVVGRLIVLAWCRPSKSFLVKARHRFEGGNGPLERIFEVSFLL